MTIDTRLEHLYQQIELVRGIGNIQSHRLCIMSFVAFLTGEAHSDSPSTVSSLIRRYAIVVNDEMPNRLRQRLKSFAPRLIGTRDGEDLARARLLVEAARTEILPRLMEDSRRPNPRFSRTLWFAPKGHQKTSAALRELTDKVANFTVQADPAVCEEIASVVGQLLSQCARVAPMPFRDWYWLKAIDLFDRLCDVVGGQPRPEIRSECLASAEAVLDRRSEIPQHQMLVFNALRRLRSLMPLLMG